MIKRRKGKILIRKKNEYENRDRGKEKEKGNENKDNKKKGGNYKKEKKQIEDYLKENEDEDNNQDKKRIKKDCEQYKKEEKLCPKRSSRKCELWLGKKGRIRRWKDFPKEKEIKRKKREEEIEKIRLCLDGKYAK